MKLKFRAEPKDIVIFIIFSLFLLYLVAIAVLNIASFSQNNTLHGLDPLPAFSGDYFAPTMVFFLFALIAIISSVSSYFFEREKGFGLATTPKTDKGYARWAKEKETKKVLKLVYPTQKTSNAAGIPLINNGKEIWVDDGEYHSLIIGSTGSGKTQAIVHPLVKVLAKKGESMIVTDPKGEIFEENGEMLKERGYNIILLNFRDPQRGNAWNPLSLPYSLYKNGNQDKANELLDDLAMNILYDEKAQNQDPFWEKTSADYFAGLCLALFEDAKEEEINLNSINFMTTVGEEKFLGNTYIKEYFNDKDKASPAYVNVASTLMAPSDTKSSILSVFKQKIKLFSSRENLSEMLAHNDFNMHGIGRRKTAVFIIIQDEKKTYHALATIFIKQCYETLIDVAQENGGKLPYRTNFILDEFANMPPLKDVTTMVTAARSRNIRFNFIIQNFAQLYQVYGKENGETIKGNCGNIIYLISSELSALEEISKMCGEVKSKEKEKTASTPLVTVSDLQRLKEWETVILRTRMMPFKTKLTPNFKIYWGEKHPKATYPVREKQQVTLFDIKKFVEEKRNNKFEAPNPMMNTGYEAPFNPTDLLGGGGMPSTPLDMDELIKRIDAKIAELEEEERREKEAMASTPTDINEIKTVPKIEDNIDEEIEDVKEPLAIESSPKEEQKVVSDFEKNVENISSSYDSKYVTDDQFFDDFFSDDEE
ncbi:MAG: type IV secretory system conjugative DNA transfer family protein [Mollicutes bacterium]|nr:type IV secretory system conjugative DNA transfer family protein [Mollicutes bacterium]